MSGLTAIAPTTRIGLSVSTPIAPSTAATAISARYWPRTLEWVLAWPMISIQAKPSPLE